MFNNNTRDKAIELVTKAVDEDSKGNYEEAYKLYISALNHFQVAIKHEKSKNNKDILLGHVNQYMSRAEELKTIIDTNGSSSSSSMNNRKENRIIEKTTDNDTEEEESDKFRLAISSKKIKESKTKWEDIIGMDIPKSILYDIVITSQEIKHLYTENCKLTKSILFYGPPGNGKTFIIQGLVTLCNSFLNKKKKNKKNDLYTNQRQQQEDDNDEEEEGTKKSYSFYSLGSSDLISKFLGDSAKHVRALFEEVKANKPAILFIDEIDCICSERSHGQGTQKETSNALTEFITQMEGIKDDMDDILIIGATNLPHIIDKAVRSRFQKRIYIKLPDEITRKSIFKNKLKKEFNILTENEYDELAKLTENFSNRDIFYLIRDALNEVINIVKYSTHFKLFDERRNGLIIPCSPSDPKGYECFFEDVEFKNMIIKPPLQMINFHLVLKDMKPSVNQNDLDQYIEFTSLYGQES
jgi:vacuolar protein-sorting-associated protein 4